MHEIDSRGHNKTLAPAEAEEKGAISGAQGKPHSNLRGSKSYCRAEIFGRASEVAAAAGRTSLGGILEPLPPPPMRCRKSLPNIRIYLQLAAGGIPFLLGRHGLHCLAFGQTLTEARKGEAFECGRSFCQPIFGRGSDKQTL